MKSPATMDISSQMGGVSLANPIILASGPPGHSPSGLARYAQAGCGAVISKTLTREARAGNPRPRVIRIAGENLINAEGTPNLGEEIYAQRLARVRKRLASTVLVISIAGTDIDEFAYMARAAQGMGAQVVDIDISCPNIGRNDAPIGGAGNWQLDRGLLEDLVRRLKKEITIPLWVKMTNQYGNLLENARVAARAGADALIPLPAVGGMPIDLKTGRPQLSFSQGVGLITGPAIKYAGIKLVADLRRMVDISIIGTGGCSSAEDLAQYIMAGADAVQMLSAFMYHGPERVGTILANLASFMSKQGYSKLDDFRGLTLKYLPAEPFALYYRPEGNASD
jgi:dihydroorotate dehydrogenase (NAD+) catalytic subunit